MKSALLVVDSNLEDLKDLEGALAPRYGAEFHLRFASSAREAHVQFGALARAGVPISLVMASRSLPDGDPIVLLNQAREEHPAAKRVLTAHYLDPMAFDVISTAMRRGRIDYFINKPWEPRFDRLYPTLDDLLAGTRTPSEGNKFEAIRIVGERWAPISQKLRDILDRSTVPHGFYDHDSEEGRKILAKAGVDGSRLPVLVFAYGAVLVAPTFEQVVNALGAKTRPEPGVYDVAVIGAGPAGLAAGVYAASEGLRTVIFEREAIGGQAGTSARIDNYLGFPRGISGKELARRAFEQTWRFGASVVFTQSVSGVRAENGRRIITLGEGVETEARSVIIATGVAYGRLQIPSVERFVSSGVFYGAPVCEAPMFTAQEVVIVGAGNSAGQAAVHLSRYAARVTMVVRGASLATCMSDYLVQKITATANIHVRLGTQVIEGCGDKQLRALVVEGPDARREKLEAAALFVLIGGVPHAQWLPETIKRDAQGYIVTGNDLVRSPNGMEEWPLERDPLFMETSMPGVFAAGDVRCNATKRVATAVGEGATVIQMVHEYLRTL